MKSETYLAHYREADSAIHTIETHLIETAYYTKKFAGKIELESLGVLLGLLHDLGKYSFEFQRYIKSAVGLISIESKDYLDPKKNKGKIDHSTAGAQLIWELLEDKIKINKLIGEIIALCVVSHHSGLIDLFNIIGEDKFSERIKKDFIETYYYEMKQKIDSPIMKQINELLNSGNIEQQLKPVVEKIHLSFYGSLRAFSKGLLVRFLFSCLVDADRLSTSDFENPEQKNMRYLGDYPGWEKLIECFEQISFQCKNHVDEQRNLISESCLAKANCERGLYYLTVPTGGGKTLSSLRFALHHANKYNLDRIIYVIPYTSIIDQNASRVSDIFSEISGDIVLEHHSNLVPEKDTYRNRVLSENWDAPIVFTTSIQLLETLYGSGTRSVRRMHQLSRSIIIFDEIQTLPIKTVHLFNNAINFLTKICSSTVVFCTATQPLLNKVNADKGAVSYSEDFELVDSQPLFKTLKRVDVQDCCENGGWTEGELAVKAKSLLRNYGSVLLIVNTKSNAKNLFNLCKGISENVYHLSTDMCPKHRKEILNKVINCTNSENPKPVVCISTQLIEAGVDVDFGAVIRSLAGLDSIAQAAGRCNRNGMQKGLGIVHVINLRDENLDMLPEIKIGQDITLRVFSEFEKNPDNFDRDRIGYKAMKRFYEYYFFKRASEMSYPIDRKKMDRDDDLLSLLSINQLSIEEYKRKYNRSPELYLRQAFKTASEQFRVIDAPTEAVIVPYNNEAETIISRLAGKSAIKEEVALLKQAQQYCVNLFPHAIKKLHKQRALLQTYEGSEIMCLSSQYYSKEFGVSIEPVNEMELLIT
ncbi:MAG: CRISPR-associated helicase Cas3' [Desulfobacteraceae bacterium]|jgi:CRISPR-associated endonuclease/helicase Cas3